MFNIRLFYIPLTILKEIIKRFSVFQRYFRAVKRDLTAWNSTLKMKIRPQSIF